LAAWTSPKNFEISITLICRSKKYNIYTPTKLIARVIFTKKFKNLKIYCTCRSLPKLAKTSFHADCPLGVKRAKFQDSICVANLSFGTLSLGLWEIWGIRLNLGSPQKTSKKMNYNQWKKKIHHKLIWNWNCQCFWYFERACEKCSSRVQK
jgi:hypothetical protein